MSEIQQKINDWAEFIKTFHLPRWDELPEIELYSDQVINFIEKRLGALFGYEDKFITTSMLHNYVKLQLIPKPEKKRYGRTHIAHLLTITILKQVLVISDIRDGINLQIKKESGGSSAYNMFCNELENSIKTMLSEILGTPAESQKSESGSIMVRMASNAFVSKMLAQTLIYFEKEEG